MRTSGTTCALSLMAVIACGGSPAPEPVPPPPQPRSADVAPQQPLPAMLDCTNPLSTLLRSGTSLSELRSAYGTPDSVLTHVTPNRHIPNATDSLFVVHYPGLTVGLREPPTGDALTYMVEVADNRYLVYPSIGVGARAGAVVTALGEPLARNASQLEYECGDVANETVTFQLQGDRVTRVLILPYVD